MSIGQCFLRFCLGMPLIGVNEHVHWIFLAFFLRIFQCRIRVSAFFFWFFLGVGGLSLIADGVDGSNHNRLID